MKYSMCKSDIAFILAIVVVMGVINASWLSTLVGYKDVQVGYLTSRMDGAFIGVIQGVAILLINSYVSQKKPNKLQLIVSRPNTVNGLIFFAVLAMGVVLIFNPQMTISFMITAPYILTVFYICRWHKRRNSEKK